MAQLVHDWKQLVEIAKTTPEAKVKIGFWPEYTTTAGQARRDMQEKLQRKISQHDPRNVAYWQSMRQVKVGSRHWSFTRQGKFKKYMSDNFILNYEVDRHNLQLIRQGFRVYHFNTKFYRDNFGHLLARMDD